MKQQHSLCRMLLFITCDSGKLLDWLPYLNMWIYRDHYEIILITECVCCEMELWWYHVCIYELTIYDNSGMTRKINKDFHKAELWLTRNLHVDKVEDILCTIAIKNCVIPYCIYGTILIIWENMAVQSYGKLWNSRYFNYDSALWT
jgi:hypothetical protein